MRLFVGVELDAAARSKAAGVMERLRRRLRAAAPDLEARWIAPGNLHITVWFIGETPEPRASELEPALSRAPFTTAAFDLELAGCGVFPPSGPPRVLWIGVRRGGESMTELYREVGERLRPFGLLPERRPYSAHLTVARVKSVGRAGSKALRESLAHVRADCGVCPVRAATLFRSRLSPHGAAYEPLLRVPLS